MTDCCRKGAPCLKHLKFPKAWRPTMRSLPLTPEDTRAWLGHMFDQVEAFNPPWFPGYGVEAPPSKETSLNKCWHSGNFGASSSFRQSQTGSAPTVSISSLKGLHFAEVVTPEGATVHHLSALRGHLRGIEGADLIPTGKQNTIPPLPGKNLRPPLHLVIDTGSKTGRPGSRVASMREWLTRILRSRFGIS